MVDEMSALTALSWRELAYDVHTGLFKGGPLKQGWVHSYVDNETVHQPQNFADVMYASPF